MIEFIVGFLSVSVWVATKRSSLITTDYHRWLQRCRPYGTSFLRRLESIGVKYITLSKFKTLTMLEIDFVSMGLDVQLSIVNYQLFCRSFLRNFTNDSVLFYHRLSSVATKMSSLWDFIPAFAGMRTQKVVTILFD